MINWAVSNVPSGRHLFELFKRLVEKRRGQFTPLLTNEYTVYFIFYSLCHGWLLLLSSSLYWDDWALYKTPQNDLIDLFRQTGSMFNIAAKLHIFFQNLGGWSYKTVTFISFFSSAIFLNKITEERNYLRKKERILFILIYLSLPLNLAKVAQVNAIAALCYALFFLAWYLIDKKRTVSAILFFIAFNVNSLLVFYAIPIAEHTYKNIRNREPLNVSSWVKFSPFLILPFFYFAIKTYYYQPSGSYEGYNTGISINNLIPSAIHQIRDHLNSYPTLSFMLLIFIANGIVREIKSNRIYFTSSQKINIENTKLLLLGIAVVFAGCAPYWMTNNIPTIYEWTSRHQLLMPLGVSIFLIAIGKMLSEKTRFFFFSLILISSATIDISSYRDFYIDWKKQKKIIEIFSENSDLRSANLVVFQDYTANLNAIHRSYRMYEWNGLMSEAFGTQKRFGISEQDLPAYNAGDLDKYFTSDFKAASHIRHTPSRPILVRLTFNNGSSKGFDRISKIENIICIVEK